MQLKVINILPHLPQDNIHSYKTPEEYIKVFPRTEFIKIPQAPYWIGFFKQDWNHHWGSYIKAVSDNIEMECWRPYGSNIKEVYSLNIEGIAHRVFPSKANRITKIGEFVSSKLMLEALKKEGESPECIIHFYGAHYSLTNYLLLNLKQIKAKVVIQQLGGWFGYYDMKNASFFLKPIKYILWKRELRSLKYCDLYLTGSKVEMDFIKNNLSLNCKFFFNGVNFDIYKSKQTKNEARALYKINENDKVILYIGRLYSTKNVNLLIDAFIKLRMTMPHLKLLLVGCYTHDEFYQKAIDAGAVVILRSDSDLDVFFNIADVYVMPTKDSNIRDFGGFGVAPIEALAYGLRVISQNIKHFAGTKEELRIIGSEIKDFNKLDVLLLKEIQSNNQTSNQVRDIAKKYFNIIENSKEIVTIYQNLINGNK